MLITFRKIILHNFASFKHAELNLDDMGYTIVQGRNYCKLDNAYSNGSGKSSIFNGLCFALTGETVSGVSNGIENIFGDPSNCWVELWFSVDSDEFKIRRFKTPRHDLKIEINGIDRSGKGVKESSKLLAEYIPDLNPKFIGSVVLLGQGLPNRFSNNDPSRRKETLEILTKSDFMIAQIKEKLEQRQDSLKDQLRVNEDSLLSKTSQAEIYTKQKQNLEEQIASYNSAENIDDLTKQLHDKKVTLDCCMYTSTSLQQSLDSLYKIKAELTNLYNSKYDNLVKEIVDEETSLLNDILHLKTETLALKKEIKKLESITDVCPTCGQKIPGAVKPDTKEQNSNLIKLSLELQQKENRSKELGAKKDGIYKANQSELQSKNFEITTQIDDTKSSINTNNLKLSSLNEEINNLTSRLSIATSIKENYKNLVNQLDDVNNSLCTLESDSQGLEKSILNINAHLSVIQQMLTLAKREFRGVLLQNVIEFINKKVKVYSQEVFGNTQLSFSLNENCIDITYCDKLYENLSGGEKQKIDIVIQLTLRDLLSNQLKLLTNLLVCDEVLDNIDSIGAEKIINIIQSQGDIDSIFFITHHADSLNMSYDKVITVEKNSEGISSILI